jgi:hypothetical protein
MMVAARYALIGIIAIWFIGQDAGQRIRAAELSIDAKVIVVCWVVEDIKIRDVAPHKDAPSVCCSFNNVFFVKPGRLQLPEIRFDFDGEVVARR